MSSALAYAMTMRRSSWQVKSGRGRPKSDLLRFQDVLWHRRMLEGPCQLVGPRAATGAHEELGRLIGGALVSPTEARPERLSRRLGQTLACLLEGDSEKQVAARLGLSQATLHQYVTAL
jgi:hypothetical protein